MRLNPYVYNVLIALAIAVLGFILLNAAFLLNFLLFRLTDIIIPHESVPAVPWYPAARHLFFLVLILVLSWLILRAKARPFFKAVYLTVPVAVTLVTVGMLLYNWPVLTYITGVLLTAGILFYLYRNRLRWYYYYATLLVALTLLVFTLSGGEI